MLGQRKLLQRLGPGLIHAFIFWGFLVLAPTILIALIGVVSKHATLPGSGDQGWFAFLVDVFAVLVLIGVASARVHPQGACARRASPAATCGEADLILALIAIIATTLLLWHATRIALGLNEWPAVERAGLGPAQRPVRPRRVDPGARARVRVGARDHDPVVPGLPAALKAPAHRDRRLQRLVRAHRRPAAGSSRCASTIPTIPEEDIRFGAGTAADLTWKQMLDTFSCTECGRCQDACPAFATGKVLSPKLLIMGSARPGVRRRRGDGDAAGRGATPRARLAALVPGAVPEESVWDCVTCGACVQACPVSIEHVDHIVDLRRHLVMVESQFPAEAEPMLRDIERGSNPWGKAQSERADWAARWASGSSSRATRRPSTCTGSGARSSFDERARRTAEATARLLQQAGVDFAILGPREACTGDPARRMGNEYVFQAFAEQNVATLNEAGVRKIITNCPHCFNTLGNEYPDFGGDYEVIHHSEVLARLVAEGRLSPQRSEGLKVTYHDSCYLARHNDVLAPPRELIGAVGQPVEMARSGKETFCCGAGGAHMWMEERASAINENRAREAAATGADTLAVACPFCTVMLDDGVQSAGETMRVADVATLLSEAIGDD